MPLTLQTLQTLQTGKLQTLTFPLLYDIAIHA